MSELYFSFDIEANGPIPGPFSMLSFGVAAFKLNNLEPVATFQANLNELEGAERDQKTMEFWAKNQAAYDACRQDTRPPDTVFRQFNGWVREVAAKHKSSPVAVAYPAGYDFTWLYWYLQRFTGDSPFSFACLDLKTLGFVILGNQYRDVKKRNFHKHWFPKNNKHTHVALEDAIEQGQIFVNMMQELSHKDIKNV